MDPTQRFSDRSLDYAAHRPAYGDDVFDFVLDGLGSHPRVADLGAGTGISSRLLAARGAEVIAIEPNESMRSRIEKLPGLRVVDSRAEETGLDTGSVDLVTAFQAFHWFAHDAALGEIRRIVRAGGRAALVLNERDESDAFTAAYGAIVRRYATDDTEERRRKSLVVFKRLPGHVEERSFTNEQWLDREGVWGRAMSSSYLPREGEPARSLRSDIESVFDRFAAGATRVRMALVTLVIRIDLGAA